MISRPAIVTADQLLKIQDDGCRYELIDGNLHMISLAGSEHGRIAHRISRRLGDHVERHALGETYAAETGFRIGSNPDTVRAPDAAFVSRRTLASVEKTVGYLPVAPDLVVEVVSPYDVLSQIESKAAGWLAAGTRIVLVADPGAQVVRVYRHAVSVQVLRPGDVFDAGDVVPGWRMAVSDALDL